MSRLTPILFLLVPLAMPLATPASGHPHAWVDTIVRVTFNGQGQVISLRQTWLFDDFYSMFVIEGTDVNGDGEPDPAALDAVTNENLKNLAEYAYFTEVRSGETVLDTGTATDASTRMVGNRLEMTFTLPLVSPVSAVDVPLSYRIFDPTYYIEMLHAEGPDVINLENAPQACVANLIKPSPSEEQVFFAASLGMAESGGNDLGRIFAEEVRVTCG